MGKKTFESPEIEIVVMSEDDIIRTSDPNGSPFDWDKDEIA